jgi:hypothetical protein
MPPILTYLLRLSISLAVVWLFYQLLLRRLTFYGLNRWYLLGYSVLSFFIPLINIYPILRDEGPVGEPYLIQFIPAVGGEGRVIAPEVHSGISGWTWLIWAIVLGALVLLVRTVFRGLSLYRLRKHARLIEGTSLKIYQVDASIIPFSFGHSIYINQHLHSEQQWSDIILHEYVHIRQRHTVDILLTELICMLNWYNPFSWLMRWSIRQNLEFIADQQVLGSGVDRKGYQYHLLTVLGEPRYRLANNFNFSSLKKRIVMMNKIRSARLHLVKFLFVIPLAAVLLVAFRDKYTDWWRPAAGQVYVNVAGIIFDLSSKDPLGGVTVVDSISGLQTTTDDRGFYKLHIPVTDDRIRIGLKFQKADYDSERSGQFIPSVKNNIGIIENMFLSNPGYHHNGAFMMFPAPVPIPEDPGYADATAALHEALQWNDNYAQYLKAQKDHGISLLYTSEDRPHDIIFLQDGTMEKYGYPGTPPLDAMEKKYGFPADIFGSSKSRGVNEGYIARWRDISAQAEKAFHTDNPDVRAVVFPGDSRVIVVPVKGKPRIFDMDNAAEAERTAFEKLYGRLPDCVPPPANNTDAQEKAAGWPGRSAGGSGSVGGAVGAGRKDTVPTLHSLPQNMLFVVDGEKMPEGWKPSTLGPDSIGTKVVMGATMALTFFGPRGVYGAVVIRTKAYEAAHPFIGLGDDKRGNPAALFGDSVLGRRVPLWVVDGKIWSTDSMQTLNPEEIESITVLKSAENTKQYGEKGKNGVIEITLKPKGAGAMPNRASSISIDGISHVEGNGTAYGAANGPRDGQAQVIFDHGKQIAIADTIKMNGITITTYHHPGGN